MIILNLCILKLSTEYTKPLSTNKNKAKEGKNQLNVNNQFGKNNFESQWPPSEKTI